MTSIYRPNIFLQLIFHTQNTAIFYFQMAQVWKVVEFKDRSTTIVPSSWLEEAGESWNCFWPPSSYDHNRLQKAVAHHLPPGAAWDVHGDVRVLVSCGKEKCCI